ncbi:MAG: bacteriocin [Alphaproteobacteria bacterium]|nr:bacteriocin [Alphaproteobacteria bacterium]
MTTNPDIPTTDPDADKPSATEELTDTDLATVSGGISTEPVPRQRNLLKPGGLTGVKLNTTDSI